MSATGSDMGRTAITIGVFDGVHLGHQALVRRCRVLAQEFAERREAPAPRVVAMVLDPHPASVLNPGSEPASLTTFEQRRELLRLAGADTIVRLPPTPDFLMLGPGGFIEQHLKPLKPVAIVEGADFRFGKDRGGSVQTLREYPWGCDITVETLDAVEVTLGDASIVPARSTMARWLVQHGRVRDASLVLGRPHAIVGEVAPGDRRGRAIGFPTANVRTSVLLPADGVYAGLATLPGGRRLPAAVSVGTKPTFRNGERTVEAFLLDPARRGAAWAPIDGLAEYGWEIRLDLVSWVRDQYRFASLNALVEQIARDCDHVDDTVRAVLSP